MGCDLWKDGSLVAVLKTKNIKNMFEKWDVFLFFCISCVLKNHLRNVFEKYFHYFFIVHETVGDFLLFK